MGSSETLKDYRQVLLAEGHTTEGEFCGMCWDAAISRARWKGGKLMDRYREIVRENRERAERLVQQQP